MVGVCCPDRSVGAYLTSPGVGGLDADGGVSTLGEAFSAQERFNHGSAVASLRLVDCFVANSLFLSGHALLTVFIA